MTEGTPVSPVFETLDELADWLVAQGQTRAAAASFVAMGSVPSGMIANGVLYRTYEVGDLLSKDRDP